MTQDHTTAAPVCYRHPDRHTMLSCSRCGRPICGSCSIEASVGQRCPECVRSEGTQKVVPTGPRGRTGSLGAPATVAIVAVTASFYLGTELGLLPLDLVDALVQKNGQIAAGEWWRIFTPVLLHGGFMHLLFNMWALWVLGPQVERSVGRLAFIGLYLASAGMGGVAFFYLGPEFGQAVGASGAIFGLFGVWLASALLRRNSVWGRAMLSQIGFLLLINAALPLMVPGIAWQAHLGGLIAGAVIGLVWSRIRANTEAMRTTVAFGFAVVAALLVII